MTNYIINKTNIDNDTFDVFRGSKKQCEKYLRVLAHKCRMASRKLRHLDTTVAALGEKDRTGNALVDMAAFKISSAGLDFLLELLNNYGIEQYEAIECKEIGIGQRIAYLRKEQGMTQKQLAEKCGMAQPNIARIEAGTYATSIDVLSRIAEALGKRIELV